MTDSGEAAARRAGLRLQRAREDAGLGQEEAAQLLGVSKVTLSRRENGKAPVDAAEGARMLSLYARHARPGAPAPADTDVAHATPAPATGPAGPPPPNGVHAPSYWRGRMEGAQRAAALVRGLATTIEHAAVSLEGDVRGIIDSGLLNDTGAAPTTLDPTPSPEVMAEARRLLDAYLAQQRAADPQNDEPPARRGRRAGGGG